MMRGLREILRGPAPDAFGAGARLAGLLWCALDRRRRHIAKSNIQLALGVSEREAERIARDNFLHLARVFTETTRMPQIHAGNYTRFVEPDGAGRLEESLRLGKGILLLTGHFGNWEWMAHTCPFFVSGRLNFVVRPVRPPWLNGVLTDLRTITGNGVIDKQDAAGPILKALAANEMVGILLDQNAGRQSGVYAPFFGGYVPTHRGMALMAIKSGAPVHPAFNWRTPSGRYRIEIQPALTLPDGGTLAERVFRMTALFNRCIEAQIRRFPDQWYWVHRRFRLYTREFQGIHPPKAAPRSGTGK